MKIKIEPSDFGRSDPLDPSALTREGWSYIDPPTRFSHEMWDLWLSTIGEDNYRILAMSAGTAADGFKWKRGQFLISQEGQRRMKEFAAQRSAVRR